MTDFAALIDRALTGAMRRRLASFLNEFQHVEFGRARKLDAEEMVLVLSAIDHFLVNDSLVSLRVPGIERVVERLSAIAAQEDGLPDEDETRVRNACFDALACIKALEAALSSRVNRAAIITARMAAPAPSANEP